MIVTSLLLEPQCPTRLLMKQNADVFKLVLQLDRGKNTSRRREVKVNRRTCLWPVDFLELQSGTGGTFMSSPGET